jgi:hypothetical protein
MIGAGDIKKYPDFVPVARRYVLKIPSHGIARHSLWRREPGVKIGQVVGTQRDRTRFGHTTGIFQHEAKLRPVVAAGRRGNQPAAQATAVGIMLYAEKQAVHRCVRRNGLKGGGRGEFLAQVGFKSHLEVARLHIEPEIPVCVGVHRAWQRRYFYWQLLESCFVAFGLAAGIHIPEATPADDAAAHQHAFNPVDLLDKGIRWKIRYRDPDPHRGRRKPDLANHYNPQYRSKWLMTG